MKLWKKKGSKFEAVRSISFPPLRGKSLGDIIGEILKTADGELCFLAFTQGEEEGINVLISECISDFSRCYEHSTGAANFLRATVLNDGYIHIRSVVTVGYFPNDPNKPVGQGKTRLSFWINHRPD